MKCTEHPVTQRHIVSDESYSQIHNLLYYATSSEFAQKKVPSGIPSGTLHGVFISPKVLHAQLIHPP